MTLNKNIQLITLLSLITCGAFSQDLSNIKDAKPFVMTSTLSANQVLYGIDGIESRRDPYSYFLSGSANISIYNVLSIPLNFTYSNQGKQYGQPFNFNQFGATPSYKWVKVYAGYSSMSFSPYTLGGHQFLGGGVELTPPMGLRFSAMYGRLRKPVESDTSNLQVIPSYRRMGYGFKAGYTIQGSSFDVMLFKAKDELNSLSFDSLNQQIAPMENLVLGLNTSIQLFKKLKFTSEIAGSSLTRDTRADKSNSEHASIFNYTGFLQPNKTTTGYYTAFKSAVNYIGTGYSVGLGYERIDPEYQTLGAYYFTNDLENITVNASKSMMAGKLNVAMNVGEQHNNLDNSKQSKMTQVVSSININYSPSQKMSLGGSYSNFASYTNVKSQFDYINNTSPYAHLDTLNYTQLTNSANFNCNYLLGDIANKNQRQNVGLSLAMQKASNQQNNRNLNSGALFINGNMIYSLSLVPNNITLSGSWNSNLVNSSDIKTVTLGPTVTVSKAFFQKKLTGTFSSSFNKSYSKGEETNQVVSCRIGGLYTLMKRHNFNINFIVINRHSRQTSIQSFTEFTGMMGYNINF